MTTKEPMPELKPCPFNCGGVVCVDTFDITPCGKQQRTVIECLGCDVRTPRFENQENAIQFWNTRSPAPDKIVIDRADVERMKLPPDFKPCEAVRWTEARIAGWNACIDALIAAQVKGE